jgi:carboxypeptidase PM20D1
MKTEPDNDLRGLGLHRDQVDLLHWLYAKSANGGGASMDSTRLTMRDERRHPQQKGPGASHNPGETSLNRTAWSATLHCLAGCAIGEVFGLVIGTALGWGNAETIALAVVLAFAFGYALTMRPLLGSGLSLARAAHLAFASDTASIAMMEVVDNVIMLIVPGAMDAPLDSLLFWASLGAALALAAVVAFPVNRYLISRGRGHAVVHAFHGERCHTAWKGAMAPRLGSIKRILLLLGVAIGLLAIFVVARTAHYGSSVAAVEPAAHIAIPAGAAERLAGSLRIPTISHEDPGAFDAEAFRALHAHLEAAFPRAHSQLRRETVGTHSLLYTWPGSNNSLKPILLMAHLDVVLVEPETESKWQADPFGGRIADGFIWGRGAIDNKSAVVGTLEAVEMLLGEGFRPERTVYLAYGHDEEVGGMRGAREIAELLKRRGVQLEMVLDEGGVIGDGILPGVSAPVALIGIAEKGFASIELSTRAPGGHSSLPPRQSTVGILGAAIAKLEQDPMPARLEGPTRQLFDRIGPQFPVAQRAVFANLWLTRLLVMRKLESNPATNAMLRTTTAATIFQAGTKDNVLASQARAVVNFRISPGDSVAGVVAHARRVIDDPRVEVRIVGGFRAEPSAVSSIESDSFRKLEWAIRSVSPDAIVAPYLVVVATDSRYFSGLSANILRILPLHLAARDIERIHGTDERISIRNYEQAIRIYRQLILNTAAG